MSTDKKMKLYKYFPLSEEKHLKYISDCLNQKIWFTALKNFNDPFEGVYVSKNRHPKEILADETLLELIYKNVCKDSGISLSEFRNMLSEPKFQENCPPENILHELFKGWGASCFTTSYDNILMWSYYASNHGGCCVEYEIDFDEIKKSLKLSDNDMNDYKLGLLNGSKIFSFSNAEAPEHRFIFLRVLYHNEPPIIDYKKVLTMTDTNSSQKYVIRNSMGQKFNQWVHENEFRLLTNISSDQLGLLSLSGYAPFLNVTGVIIGSRMQECNTAPIRQLCTALNINIYNTRCSKDNYKIIVDGYVPLIG